jgi:hypothetical protein
MSHLSIERLAALADEPPTADEISHMDACDACAQEVAAHRQLLAMAGSERDVMGIPLTRWDSLATRLRAEGLISDEPMSVTAEFAAPLGSRRPSGRAMMRFAAAILLVAGGVVAGRASTGASMLPEGAFGTGGPAGGGSEVAARPFGESQIPTTFASLEEAQRYKELYAAAYQNAVAFLAENDSVARGTPAVMRARLSALDRVSRTMREALNDAPYDPVINDFYINSFGQREATLRQLNTVLPQGVRMNGF